MRKMRKMLLAAICMMTVGLSGLTANAASREAEFDIVSEDSEFENRDNYGYNEIDGELEDPYLPPEDGEVEESYGYNEIDGELEEPYLPPVDGEVEESYGYNEIDGELEDTYLPPVNGDLEEDRPSPSIISDIDVGMGVVVTICTDGNTGEISILFVNQESPKERGEDCGIPIAIAQNGAIVGIKDGQVILIKPAPLPYGHWGQVEEVPTDPIIMDDIGEKLDLKTPTDVDIYENTSVEFVPRKGRELFKGTHSYAELWRVTDENVGGLQESFAGLLSKAEKDICFDGTVTLSYLQSLNPKADTIYQGYIRLNGQDGYGFAISQTPTASGGVLLEGYFIDLEGTQVIPLSEEMR